MEKDHDQAIATKYQKLLYKQQIKDKYEIEAEESDDGALNFYCDDERNKRVSFRRTIKQHKIGNKEYRNQSFLDYHTQRFKQVGLFKMQYAGLLDQMTAQYAADYVPPGRRKQSIDQKVQKLVVSDQTIKKFKATTPLRMKPISRLDIEETLTEERKEIDSSSFMFSDASRLIPEIVQPLQYAKDKNKMPLLNFKIQRSYLKTIEETDRVNQLQMQAETFSQGWYAKNSERNQPTPSEQISANVLQTPQAILNQTSFSMRSSNEKQQKKEQIKQSRFPFIQTPNIVQPSVGKSQINLKRTVHLVPAQARADMQNEQIINHKKRVVYQTIDSQVIN